MKSISWVECFFIFEINDFRGVGLFSGVYLISFGILFQILGPVQHMDCAHLAVDEATWTIDSGATSSRCTRSPCLALENGRKWGRNTCEGMFLH